MDLLPTELIQSVLFPYLTRKELKRISLNRRLEEIAESVMEKRDRKSTYIFLYLGMPYIGRLKRRLVFEISDL